MKNGYFLNVTGCLMLVLVYFCLSFWTAKTFSFEEFLKGIDFEQLTKDIEEAVEAAEQKGHIPSYPGMGGTQTSESTTPISPLDLTLTTPTTQKSEDLGQDLEKLFLEPIIVVQEKGKTAPIKVPDQKEKAYEHYMGKMVELMTTLELAIETNPRFSDLFRSFFTHFQDAIDEIIVQKDIIGSKKLYLALLFTDNEATNQLRKKIVVAVKELSKFCDQVSISEAEEIKTAEQEEDKLRNLAKQNLATPKTDKQVQRKTRGQRGAPTKQITKIIKKKKISPEDNQEAS